MEVVDNFEKGRLKLLREHFRNRGTQLYCSVYTKLHRHTIRTAIQNGRATTVVIDKINDYYDRYVAKELPSPEDLAQQNHAA